MKLAWEAAAETHVGRVRKGNEDTFLVDAPRGLFLVADGMGGHAAGEVASSLAADTVGAALRDGIDRGVRAEELAAAMARSFREANQAIMAWSARDPLTVGMGTTLTALVACDDGSFQVGHVGDSRMYVLRHGELQQVTRDHTWVQREVDEGRLTPRGARTHRYSHILTRALGTETAQSAEAPDVFEGTFLPGDVALLATDGLTGMLTDRMLHRILERGEPLQEAVKTLIWAANRRGGRDNITAVLVRFHDPEVIPEPS